MNLSAPLVSLGFLGLLAGFCALANPPAGKPEEPEPLLDYALSQWRHTPELGAEDAYKWLFQAALGGEHAVSDSAGARKWLETEWEGLGEPPEDSTARSPNSRPPEVLAESLRADGSILRIHLRPFKSAGGNPDVLLGVFVASARSFRGDKKEFLRAWSALGRRLEAGPIGRLDHESWKALDEISRPLGYPAVHHSKEYEERYRPAYRVVLASAWREHGSG